ncbi:hypothetical protein [Oryzobacter terrae]|uniref:DUF7282 domain-containing protein n=1 Tax=Oryzobacter terrae TaxID=1620385 RepID=UPI003672CBE9
MRTTPLAAAVAATAALALGACGTAPAPEAPAGPIVLRSSATSGTPTPSATPTTPATGGAAPVVPDVRDADAEVGVQDQAGDGRSVLVEEVVLGSGPGHAVVVDRSTRAVLGSAPVRAGTSRDVAVALSTPVPRSGEYLVMLYADDGDGTFEETRDGLVVEADDDGGGDDGGSVDEDFRYTLR